MCSGGGLEAPAVGRWFGAADAAAEVKLYSATDAGHWLAKQAKTESEIPAIVASVA